MSDPEDDKLISLLKETYEKIQELRAALEKRTTASKGHVYTFSGMFMEVHDLERELFRHAVMEAMTS